MIDTTVAVPLSIIRDQTLSWKVKGLLLFALTCPLDTHFSVEFFCQHMQEGRDSIRSSIKKLEAAGYLVKRRERQPNGTYLECQWDFYSVPNGIEECQNISLKHRRLTRKSCEQKVLSTVHNFIHVLKTSYWFPVTGFQLLVSSMWTQKRVVPIDLAPRARPRAFISLLIYIYNILSNSKYKGGLRGERNFPHRLTAPPLSGPTALSPIGDSPSSHDVKTIFEKDRMRKQPIDKAKEAAVDTPPPNRPSKAPAKPKSGRVPRKARPDVLKLGHYQNVYLFEKELKALEDAMGESTRDQLIEELSTYIESTKDKYTNHDAVIRAWYQKRKKDNVRLRHGKPLPKWESEDDEPFKPRNVICV